MTVAESSRINTETSLTDVTQSDAAEPISPPTLPPPETTASDRLSLIGELQARPTRPPVVFVPAIVELSTRTRRIWLPTALPASAPLPKEISVAVTRAPLITRSRTVPP